MSSNILDNNNLSIVISKLHFVSDTLYVDPLQGAIWRQQVTVMLPRVQREPGV